MNRLKWSIFCIFFLSVSCKRHLIGEKKVQIVENLKCKTPVIFRCTDSFPEKFWIGDYMTATDTITSINSELREQTLAVRKTLRFGKWLLKDEDGIIYAEAFYNNDTLTSFKKYAAYPASCNMDSMIYFSDRDTAFVTTVY